jgi:hypothetical protein
MALGASYYGIGLSSDLEPVSVRELANFGVRTGGEYSGKLSIAGLKKFVADESITTPEELLSRLPERIRSRFTLIHRGESLQFQENCISEKDPRVVLFSPEDRFVMAFTNSKISPACYNPEMMELRADGSIDFDFIPMMQSPAGTKPLDKTKCQGCHGAQSYPIWSSYPLWHGAYGSNDDSPSEVPEERERIEKYASYWRNQGIYRLLSWKRDAYFPYSTQRQTDHNLRPNMHLGMLLARIDGIRVAHQIARNEQYRKQGATFLRTHLKCDERKTGVREIEPEEIAAFGVAPETLRVGDDGESDVLDYALVELLRIETSGNAEMAALLAPKKRDLYTQFHSISLPIRKTVLNKDKKFDLFCNHLKTRQAIGIDPLAQPIMVAALSSIPADRQVFSTCISCHEDEDIAPLIPFAEDDATLRSALLGGRYRSGTLFDEIVARVTHAKVSKRMPLDAPPLDPQTELPAFLEKLRAIRDGR